MFLYICPAIGPATLLLFSRYMCSLFLILKLNCLCFICATNQQINHILGLRSVVLLIGRLDKRWAEIHSVFLYADNSRCLKSLSVLKYLLTYSFLEDCVSTSSAREVLSCGHKGDESVHYTHLTTHQSPRRVCVFMDFELVHKWVPFLQQSKVQSLLLHFNFTNGNIAQCRVTSGISQCNSFVDVSPTMLSPSECNCYTLS